MSVAEYELRAQEKDELLALMKSLSDAKESPGSPGFYDIHWTALEGLPLGLRRFFEGIRRGGGHAACLVHGFPLNDAMIGPTPLHWDAPESDERARDAEIYLGVCAMALGEPFTWATLQSGRIIQNILPIAGDEDRQNGYGSDALLEFHTEDGFHPGRCDYLMLLGLRNPDRVPTTVASVWDIELGARERRVLSERRFHILPDDEHIRQLEARSPDHAALREARLMRDQPEPVAVLFGTPERPYLRLDRPFMSVVGADRDAERALDRLMEELLRVQRDVVVEQGSLLLVDNYAAVHGRRSFASRYDGTDRWLKKITVRLSLRQGDVSTPLSGSRVLI